MLQKEKKRFIIKKNVGDQMKKYLIKIIYFFILFILIIETPYSQAANNTSTGSDIHLDITSDEFLEDFNPNNKNMTNEVNAIVNPLSTTIVNVANIILGIVQVIGGILAVVSITIFGLNLVLSTHKPLAIDLGFGKTPDERRAMVDFGRSLLIGAVLLLASVTFVKLLMDLLLT